MGRAIKAHLTFLFVVLVLGQLSLAGDKQNQAAELISKTLQQSNVWKQGAVQLTADVRIPSATRGPDLNLSCQVYWESADKWRIEWSGAGYVEQIVANDGKLYRNRNSSPPPIQVLALNNALAIALGNTPVAPFFQPLPSQKSKVEVSEAKIKGVSTECVEPSSIRGKVCVDPSTLHVLEYDDSGMIATYEDFVSFHDATYSRGLHLATKDGKQVADAKITITSAPQFPDGTFKPLESGVAYAYASCSDLEKSITLPKLDNKIFPHYPEAARNARQQGTVWLYAAIRENGSMDKVEALGGAAPELRKASADSVKQWKYSPGYARCGVPSAFETLISINFTLQ